MKALTLENAKEYTVKKFKELPNLYYQWNIIHSEGMIAILKILVSNKNIDKERLFALAWIHDIGKIKSDKDHAEISLGILEKEFKLNETDRDCILNHGSSGTPKTEEGKVFRYADGLSLFFPKTINFKFYAEAKEGFKFEEVQKRIMEMYERYKVKYSNSPEILSLLEKLFNQNFPPPLN